MLEPEEHFLYEKREQIPRTELISSRTGKVAVVCVVKPPAMSRLPTRLFSGPYLESTQDNSA